MSGKDIDLCDSLELLSYIYKETEYFCSNRDGLCHFCPCSYDDEDDIYSCRKDHLLKRIRELSGERGVINE